LLSLSFFDVAWPRRFSAQLREITMRYLWTFLGCAALLIAPARGAEDKKDEARRGERSAAKETSKEYWIGAMCAPVDGALRNQLDLEDTGLIVLRVVADSPAAKAGLKEHDVITAIDGEEVDDVADLMAAVREAGDKKLSLKVFRSGQSKTIDVTPGLRPDNETLLRLSEGPRGAEAQAEAVRRMREMLEQAQRNLPEGEAKRMQEWVERAGRGEQGPLRMHMFGPGVVMNGQVRGVELPEGVTVTLKKTGREPLSIQVERGDERWGIKPQELDRLPPELRGPVGAMIGSALGGRNPGAPQVGFGPQQAPQGDSVWVVSPQGAATAAASGSGPVDVQIRIDNGRGGVQSLNVPFNPAPRGGLMPGASMNPTPGPSRREFEALQNQLNGIQKQLAELTKNQAAANPATKPSMEKKEPAKPGTGKDSDEDRKKAAVLKQLEQTLKDAEESAKKFPSVRPGSDDPNKADKPNPPKADKDSDDARKKAVLKQIDETLKEVEESAKKFPSTRPNPGPERGNKTEKAKPTQVDAD
jgi:hypothetical protein